MTRREHDKSNTLVREEWVGTYHNWHGVFFC